MQPGAIQASCEQSEEGHIVDTPNSAEPGYRNQTLANTCTVLHALHNVATTVGHLGLTQPRWTMHAWLEREWCPALEHYCAACPGASAGEDVLSCKMFPSQEGDTPADNASWPLLGQTEPRPRADSIPQGRP